MKCTIPGSQGLFFSRFTLGGTPTHLSRETPVADVAPEWPLLGVRAHVDLERRVAGERLEADRTRGVPAGCVQEEGRVHY